MLLPANTRIFFDYWIFFKCDIKVLKIVLGSFKFQCCEPHHINHFQLVSNTAFMENLKWTWSQSFDFTTLHMLHRTSLVQGGVTWLTEKLNVLREDPELLPNKRSELVFKCHKKKFILANMKLSYTFVMNCNWKWHISSWFNFESKYDVVFFVIKLFL